MSIVTLVSGGLDSSLVALLTKEAGTTQFPLFVDYGQRARERELRACRAGLKRLGLLPPRVAQLSGYGKLIRSGLTDDNLHVMEDAFTPGRNMMFLLVGAAYACTVNASGVAIGLLHESTSLFPDQTGEFLSEAQRMLSQCMGRQLRVLAPLATFTKKDVVALAKKKGLRGTYSCHVGGAKPCGKCISCREFRFEEA